jgi:hypothetical protein
MRPLHGAAHVRLRQRRMRRWNSSMSRMGGTPLPDPTPTG